MTSMEYPMRINRYLAMKGYASRREADEFIKDGKVKINGRIAKIGDKVEEKDSITVDEGAIGKKLVYLAYNKPRGVVTHSAEESQEEIKDVIKYPIPIFPIGRLDRDSRGLIILTNDGRLTGRLLEPHRGREREYVVTVEKPVTENFIKRMTKGVRLEDGFMAVPKSVVMNDEYVFRIVLTEGKRHEIRRMCAALGYVVRDLERVRIMNIRLKNIKAGAYREIVGKEKEKFLGEAGLMSKGE